jgi:hypothetical protein
MMMTALDKVKDIPATKFFHKGQWHDILEAKVYDYDELNALQQLHLDGLVDLYQPRTAEACRWKHIADEKGQFVSAHEIEGTCKTYELPAYADAWKEDYKRRLRNGKSTRNR